MALRYWGWNRGGDEFSVVDQSSAPGTDLVVTLDDSKGIEQGELTYALRMIENAILKSKNVRLNVNG